MNLPMNPIELELRRELAALYRVVEHLRMSDLIYTHISVRVPGPHEHFLINRYGVMFQEMRPDDLVKVDLEGAIVDPADRQRGAVVNPAGFTIHSAIHAARRDVGCIVHTHTTAGIAVAAQQDGLLPISQHALKYYRRLAYHRYEGIAFDLAERERLVRDLGTRQAMILRNHGLLAVGASVPEAFDQIYFLERACQIQIAAQSAGATLTQPDAEVCEHTAQQYECDGEPPWVRPAWEAAKRLVPLPAVEGFASGSGAVRP